MERYRLCISGRRIGRFQRERAQGGPEFGSGRPIVERIRGNRKVRNPEGKTTGERSQNQRVFKQRATAGLGATELDQALNKQRYRTDGDQRTNWKAFAT